MKINEILSEAGEPTNPSRRGFLRGLAGAAATAAMPGGVANLVKAAPTAAPAAAPAAATGIADLLFSAAIDAGTNLGLDLPADDAEDDEENQFWDSELEQQQGEYGEMPWQQYYEFGKTPNGVPYLHTTDSDDGVYSIFTFMDNGKPQTFVVAHERGGYSEVINSSDPKYTERWYNAQDDNDFDGDPNEIIDAILDPEFDAVPGERTGNKKDDAFEVNIYYVRDKTTGANIDKVYAANDEDATKEMLAKYDPAKFDLVDMTKWAAGDYSKKPRTVNVSSGTGIADLARLAGIAKQATPTQSAPAQQTTQKPAQAALPAPSNDNVLEPDLNKQKEKVPVNKDKK